MKKLLGIVVLGLLLSGNVYAEHEKYYIKEKSGENFAVYNMYVKDFNKWNDEDEGDYSCRDIPSTLTKLIDGADCGYRKTLKYMSRNDLDIDQGVLSALYDFYIDVRSRAVILHQKWPYDRSNMVKEYDVFTSYYNSELEKTKFYIRDLWVQLALRKNREYYASTKKNKKGLNIGDNEIVAASSGTGFFVSRQGHMITNHHVIDGCLNVKVIYNGKDYDTKTLSVDKMNDLAIIKTDARPRSVFSVSDRDASLLENVIVAGYPLGKKVSSAIKATSGTVTALAGVGDNYAEFQTDAALNSGNSGGPIINDQGNVVGVAVSKIKKEGVESFNFGVKSSILRIFAGANELKFLTPNKRDLKKKDLGELITDATVYLECWMTGRDLKILIAQENSMKAFYSNFK